jgi:hypothetical protein
METKISNEVETGNLQQGAVSGSLQYREPLCLTVKYALAFDFRALVEQMQDCKIKNVIEIKSGELLQYWIDCPKEKENDITDMAFMTWIKNPVFQKYYHDTRAFKEIAEKYVTERCQQ